MSVTHIQQSIENVTNYLSEHPEPQLWKKDCAFEQKGHTGLC